MDNREPLKLLTELSYIGGEEGDDVWLEIEIRLKKRNEYDSKYVYVKGFASHLKDNPNMFEGCYVERILYAESDDEFSTRHLMIRAVKEVNEND
jgi:hypothetical protein